MDTREAQERPLNTGNYATVGALAIALVCGAAFLALMKDDLGEYRVSTATNTIRGWFGMEQVDADGLTPTERRKFRALMREGVGVALEAQRDILIDYAREVRKLLDAHPELR